MYITEHLENTEEQKKLVILQGITPEYFDLYPVVLFHVCIFILFFTKV